MKYVYVISMVTENKMRVLQRIASVIARHRLNVMNMNVYEIMNTKTSYFSVTFQSDEKTTRLVMMQLKRIVELLDIQVSSKVPLTQTNLLEKAVCL